MAIGCVPSGYGENLIHHSKYQAGIAMVERSLKDVDVRLKPDMNQRLPSNTLAVGLYPLPEIIFSLRNTHTMCKNITSLNKSIEYFDHWPALCIFFSARNVRNNIYCEWIKCAPKKDCGQPFDSFVVSNLECRAPNFYKKNAKYSWKKCWKDSTLPLPKRKKS